MNTRVCRGKVALIKKWHFPLQYMFLWESTRTTGSIPTATFPARHALVRTFGSTMSPKPEPTFYILSQVWRRYMNKSFNKGSGANATRRQPSVLLARASSRRVARNGARLWLPTGHFVPAWAVLGTLWKCGPSCKFRPISVDLFWFQCICSSINWTFLSQMCTQMFRSCFVRNRICS